jgi:hypothetical protein
MTAARELEARTLRVPCSPMPAALRRGPSRLGTAARPPHTGVLGPRVGTASLLMGGLDRTKTGDAVVQHRTPCNLERGQA